MMEEFIAQHWIDLCSKLHPTSQLKEEQAIANPLELLNRVQMEDPQSIEKHSHSVHDTKY